jgi:hypothetical protein
MAALPEKMPSRAPQRRNADRTCVFCDEHIAPGTPAEHVIPDWIRRLRPDGTLYQHKSKQPGVLTHRSKRIDMTAKTVCRECNHGWMSDLETNASPILKPMIDGRPQGLSVEQHVLLSQWATKTAFMLDQSFKPSERAVPFSACRYLKQYELPPPGTVVQLGHYEGDGDFIATAHNRLHARKVDNREDPGPADAFRAAMRIHQLVIGVTVIDGAPITLRATGDYPDLLTTIWPSAELASWPPGLASTIEPGPGSWSPNCPAVAASGAIERQDSPGRHRRRSGGTVGRPQPRVGSRWRGIATRKARRASGER